MLRTPRSEKWQQTAVEALRLLSAPQARALERAAARIRDRNPESARSQLFGACPLLNREWNFTARDMTIDCKRLPAQGVFSGSQLRRAQSTRSVIPALTERAVALPRSATQRLGSSACRLRANCISDLYRSTVHAAFRESSAWMQPGQREQKPGGKMRISKPQGSWRQTKFSS